MSLLGDRYFIHAGQVYARPGSDHDLARAVSLSSVSGILVGVVGYYGWRLFSAMGEEEKPASAFVKGNKSLAAIRSIEHSLEEEDRLRNQLKELSQAFAVNNLFGNSPQKSKDKEQVQATVDLEEFHVYSSSRDGVYDVLRALDLLEHATQGTDAAHLQAKRYLEQMRSCMNVVETCCTRIREVMDANDFREDANKVNSIISIKSEMVQNYKLLRVAYQAYHELLKSMDNVAPLLEQQFRDAITQFECTGLLNLLTIEAFQLRNHTILLIDHNLGMPDHQKARMQSVKQGLELFVRCLHGFRKQSILDDLSQDLSTNDTAAVMNALAHMHEVVLLLRETQPFLATLVTRNQRAELPVMELTKGITTVSSHFVHLYSVVTLRTIQALAIKSWMHHRQVEGEGDHVVRRGLVVNELASRLMMGLLPNPQRFGEAASPRGSPNTLQTDLAHTDQLVWANELFAHLVNVQRSLVATSENDPLSFVNKALCAATNLIGVTVLQYNSGNLVNTVSRGKCPTAVDVFDDVGILLPLVQEVGELLRNHADEEPPKLVVGADTSMSMVSLLLEPDFSHRVNARYGNKHAIEQGEVHEQSFMRLYDAVCDALLASHVNVVRDRVGLGVSRGERVVQSVGTPETCDVVVSVVLAASGDKDTGWDEYVFVRQGSAAFADLDAVYASLSGISWGRRGRPNDHEGKGTELVSAESTFSYLVTDVPATAVPGLARINGAAQEEEQVAVSSEHRWLSCDLNGNTRWEHAVVSNTLRSGVGEKLVLLFRPILKSGELVGLPYVKELFGVGVL